MTASQQRRVGRILSLGFPLPGTLVDNYNILTAPTFFDYDALVIDAAHVSPLIECVLDGSLQTRSFGGDTIRIVPERSGEVSLADVLRRRVEETGLLLDGGGLVVVFAGPPGPGVGIPAVEPLENYFWLRPRAPGLLSAMHAADGTRSVVTDYEHPLAAFIDRHAANVAYRAYFDAPAELRVFAESAGGKAIAVDARAGGGRIIALPAMTPFAGAERYDMSDDLQAGIRRILGVMAEGRAPGWTTTFALSGLDERRRALDLALAARDEAVAALTDAEGAHDELDRFRRLLWQEGRLGLGEVIVDALRLIGFDVVSDVDGNIELRIDGDAVMVEYEASEGAIGMAAHHRLRQRIERAIERRGTAPRGLLLVNGYRLTAPAERAPQVADAVRIASETMQYCIPTTVSLFDAVASQLNGETASVAAFRERILTTHGVLEA